MAMTFISIFYVLCAICAVAYLITRSAVAVNYDVDFQHFQQTYLFVYLLAMGSDWLQGPHVYVLYESYGMTTHQIEVLFVAGFGSSMLFGTIVGSFADKYGRRNNCLLFGALYIMSCITKHFPYFWVLMIGRLLGGIATSILYSAFESWAVYEHHDRRFDDSSLAVLFSHATLGNSLVAIGCGLLAQIVADLFGFVAPFDMSAIVLVLMIIIIGCTWKENYGDSNALFIHSFGSALKTVKNDHKVLCLGIVQSLFEGSMYTFVLEWTPALSPPIKEEEVGQMHEDHRGIIPHGHVFATFMVAIMLGSSIFKLLSAHVKPESFMRFILLIAAASLLIPVIFPAEQTVIFIAFIVFEACVGVFWPAMGTMRGMYVPEASRSTIMTLFRIPLNFIVVAILLQNLSLAVIFKCCVTFLLLAAMTQHWMYKLSEKCDELSTTNGKLEKLKSEQPMLKVQAFPVPQPPSHSPSESPS